VEVEGKLWYVVAHRPAFLLLKKDNTNEYWLMGMDEGSYFVSLLPEPASSIRDAFGILIPEEVREAQEEGREVKRQGEWFFVEANDLAEQLGIPKTNRSKKADKLGLIRFYPLPDKTGQSGRNAHLVTYCYKTDRGLLVSGQVRHVRKNDYEEKTGEHRTLRSGKSWYIPYQNTSLKDFSSQGRVD
jgi:hypothetical protein